MFQGRSFRAARSLRRRLDSEDDNIVLDYGNGVPGVLRQMVGHVCRQDGPTKSRRLGYLNAAVRAVMKIKGSNIKKSPEEPMKIQIDMTTSTKIPITSPTEKASEEPLDSDKGSSCQIDFGEEELTMDHYFCLLRCCLVHEGREVRAGGLRLLRYLIQTKEDVKALIAVNTVPLIVRCIDIMLDNQVERVQGLRLARRMLLVAPDLFPVALARCLVAIARDGAKERDRLLRSALATLNEMAILNPHVFVECGGVGVVLHNILDCAMPRINEALIGSILYLLNTPEWRPHCGHLHMILAPFSDFHYMHTNYDPEYYSKSEERELRTQAGKLALLVCLRSWSGLISLCQPHTAALRSLVALLYPSHEDTRKAIVEVLYEVFRVPMVDWTGDYEIALANYRSASASDTDLWRLHEGFVAAEAKTVLPHIAKFRPNLIQNHLALVLYTLMCVDLVPALCEVIVSCSAPLSVRTTLLLAELLHQSNQNLPSECVTMWHSLPLLLECAAGSDAIQRTRATQAITALLTLSKTKLASPTSNTSLYLAAIINHSPKAKETTPKAYKPAMNIKYSKWLGKDHDELIQQTMKESEVMVDGKNHGMWKWDLIVAILKWPSVSLQKLEESNYKLFVKRVLYFYKPSAGLFANVALTHDQAQSMAQTLIQFCDFLLATPQDDGGRYLEELLVDLGKHLGLVVCERPQHDAVLSPSHLNTTAAQYYFLAIGNLSRSTRGHHMLLRSGIMEQLQELVSVSISDMYAKLVATCLDYSSNDINRSVLTKILTGCQESARVYATNLLRVFVRVGSEDFAGWGVELLVAQLNDESRVVSLTALDVLEEACDNEEYLDAVLCAPPSVLHLGDRGQLLMAKLISSPRGFKAYHDANFITTLMDKWAAVYNYKYVRLVQTQICDAMTQHQRGEDGQYGRRSGSKHVVHDVFLLPHLYGSLTQHRHGFSLLMQNQHVKDMVQIVKAGEVSTSQDIFQLKAAIWALGHIGLSSDGAGFLSCEGVLPSFTHLAANCSVYSVRGTCFQALCLVATTKEGASLLKKLEWECVQRHHHERWQFVDESCETVTGIGSQAQGDDNYITIGSHLISESDVEDLDLSKRGFYVGDDSEDGSESGSIMVEGIGLDDPYPKSSKSQTLPHNTKKPSFIGHQRSLSDCAPVVEELTPSDSPPVKPSKDDLTIGKRSSHRLSKLLASVRRKRRESTSSRASNSSTASERMTDRMAVFLQSARRVRGISSHSHSLTDATGSDEEAVDQHFTMSSESLSDPAHDIDFSGTDLPQDSLDTSHDTPQSQTYTPNLTRPQIECRLSPIASGASLATMGSQVEGVELRRGGRGGSIRGSSGALFAGDETGDRTGGSTTPVLPGSAPAPTHQPLSTQSYLTLRSITNHRRVVSESSQEEKNSRNSLKGFLSSSYEQSHHLTLNFPESRGMIRSPSGCSEVSSVRSGVRGGTGLGRITGAPTHGTAAQHYSGRCYLGLALPLDLDLLLYDASMDKALQDIGGINGTQLANGTMPKDRFPAITESEFETQSEEKIGKRKLDEKSGEGDGKKEGSESNKSGLKLHTQDLCLGCFTITPPPPSHSPLPQDGGEGETTGATTGPGIVVESPPLQRVKVTSESANTPESSSITSQNWDDLGDGKSSESKSGPNQILIRKEVLRFITNLLSSIAARQSEAGLLILKQRWPQAFCDLCLYSEICLILASYNYRLNARRFVQELFMDVIFVEVYREASRILKLQQPEGVCETVNPTIQETMANIPSFSLQPPSMADIAEVALSDKSDKEEDC